MRSVICQKKCEECQKKFDVTTKDRLQRFCCFTCSSNHKKTGQVKKCLNCGESVYKKKSQLRKTFFCGITCSNAYRRKKRFCKHCQKGFTVETSKSKTYCSDSCRNKQIQEYQPTTRDGKDKKIRRIWLSFKLPSWCLICKYDKVFELHHINGRINNNIYDIINIISLCPNHHWEADHKLINKDELYKIRNAIIAQK